MFLNPFQTNGIFHKNIVFLSLKIDFDVANSADPDELLHYVYCLPKYPFRGFQPVKG